MKKMVGTTFFVIMLTMSVIVVAACFAANAFIDPPLKDLETTIVGLQPEVRAKLIPHLTALERLRETAELYVPSVLLLAGLTMTLILSPLLRRFAKRPGVSYERPQKMQTEISRTQQMRPEIDAHRLVDIGACRIMAILQNKGRLIDFLQEDIAGYPDDQIGAAVRPIHEDCRNALGEYITLVPVMPEEEGETVVVSEGFDPSEIRLSGEVTGKAPFRGTVQHPGWKVTKINLPDQPKGQKHTIIAPAEVEIGVQLE
jgi:hypothetical protein